MKLNGELRWGIIVKEDQLCSRMGYYDGNMPRRIVIDDYQCSVSKLDTFLHECLHAIDDLYGNKFHLDHKFINKAAPMLMCFLSDMGLLKKVSKKEVDEYMKKHPVKGLE